MQDFINAIALLPERYKDALMNISPEKSREIKEIRFRTGEAITVNTSNHIYYLSSSGRLSVSYSDNALATDSKDLQEIVFTLSRRSMHTYQDMIVKGFIPLYGGAKAGIAGRAVMRDGGIYSVTSFNSINIRISRAFKGCADDLLSRMGDCTSYMIIGSPMSGKTTLLRELCRQYAGRDALAPRKVAVVDERDEIASRSFGHGIDVGAHTDVLTLYPKAIGTEIAVRTLSPEIIVLDEIGTEEESRALLSGMNSGVDFIATAHGHSFEEVLRRPNIKTLINAGAFKKIAVLEGKGAPCKLKELISL